MKRLTLFALCLTLSVSVSAQSQPEKTVVAVRGAYVVSLSAEEGWGLSLRQLTYWGKSDLYFGWISTLASAGPATIAEAGPLVGFAPLAVKGPNMDVSVALDLLSARSTALPTLVLQSPGLQLSLGLVLPVSQGVEVELSFSPVLRPYNLLTGSWDYTGSTFSMGLEVRFGRYVTAQTHYWTDAGK